MISNAVMVNVLGEQLLESYRLIENKPDWQFHFYGKNKQKRSQDGTYHYLDRRHPANAGRNQTNEYLGLEEKNMLERYTRPEMGNIWTEENKYRAWLEVEILADEAWAELGEIPQEDVKKFVSMHHLISIGSWKSKN